MWFELKGDERLGRCASEKCGGQPTYRFECDGVGSSYCSGCKSKIDWASRRPTMVARIRYHSARTVKRG